MIVDLDEKSHSCETLSKGSSESAQTHDPNTILKNLRLQNVNRLICAQLKINCIRNKFDSLVNIINNNNDILMISEKKTRSIFSNSFTFMVFLNLIDLIEMVTVVEYFSTFMKKYLKN